MKEKASQKYIQDEEFELQICELLENQCKNQKKEWCRKRKRN